ncbi:MAG: pseudaminic acid synthase [Deltaproteobacteria bacterium]|nr:pseudaminic acid synthase [Deltaproteobacteria bacterium]
MCIANRRIGRNCPPFIIAEMSGNHNKSLGRALKIVEAAAATGVHALKIQTYTADTMTLPEECGGYVIDDRNSLWNGTSLYSLYKEAHTPWEWHKPIFDRCAELGVIGFSSPFDETSVDFLESLDVPCYKIASFENTDWPLLKRVAATGKPVIMSTGMATVAELDEAVSLLKAGGCKNLTLLKCTSTYPASPEDSNLLTIPHMRELFGCEIGLSDHTMGIGVAIAGVALGASIVEKHFTLDRGEGGVDSAFSLEPDELAALVTETKAAWQGLGRIQYGSTQREKRSLEFRRSIFVTRKILAGEPFTTENIKVLRPNLGMEPRYFDLVLGAKAVMSLNPGTPLRWEHVMQRQEVAP